MKEHQKLYTGLKMDISESREVMCTSAIHVKGMKMKHEAYMLVNASKYRWWWIDDWWLKNIYANNGGVSGVASFITTD